MTNTLNQSRRDFLKQSAVVGGALALEFNLPTAAFAKTGAAQKGSELTAWVVINPDNSVIIRVARTEMGQGSSTGLPMLVAEELECDWSKVKHEFASTAEHIRRNRVWVTMATGGSRAIRDSNQFLRKAGATARQMLVTAAAQQWNVPASECYAENSIITHRPSGRKTTFGAIAEAASKIEPPKDVALKDPKDWKLLGMNGRPVKRFDIPSKVNGKAVFGIDVRLPGMVYAAIAQCPVFGGKPKNLDSSAAEKMRGFIKVVTGGDFVAVVADNWWRAQNAVDALKIEWDEGANGKVSSASIIEFLKAGLNEPTLPVARKDGDVAKAFAGAAKVLEAEYYTPYLNHATMEPMGATALIKGDRVEVWVSTQNAEAALAAAAATAGVPLANVEVYKQQAGGGFGRRGAFQDFVKQAVTIAKETPGKPVKLVWSREEDMQHGNYRPVSMIRQKAALDASGNLIGWQARIAAQSWVVRIRPEDIKNGVDASGVTCYADSPYAVPNFFVEYAMRNTHVPVGPWRSVSHSQNPLFREGFLDEIAVAAGKDPYQMRRELLVKSPKYLGVLDACAKAAGWGNPLPAGVYRGISVVDAYGSYAAAVIEISVGANKRLDIKRIVLATDPGYVANVDAAKAQMESNVTYGLTAALFGENTVMNGRIEQSNFDNYLMMRIKDMPKIELVLVPSGGFWGGMGEPPLTPLAPSLVNAIFAATGERIRSLPLKNHGYTI